MGPLTVSPLTQGEIKGMLSILADRGGGPWRFNPVVHWSISKKHPEITLEKLEAGIDMEDFGALFDAILGISNIEPGTIKTGRA
jgi:hypothetical protein